MKKAMPARTVLTMLALACGCSAIRAMDTTRDELTIAESGRSQFTIVVAAKASPSTRFAAAELQRFLEEISGVRLPVLSDAAPVGEHEIILGDNAHLRQRHVDIDFKTLGDEGYILRTAGPHLVIAGGAKRGNIYGVYGLLEDHLGCRWFTPEVSRIPRKSSIIFGPLDETRIPVLESRASVVYDCMDADWCARNRINSLAPLAEKHGGHVGPGSGMFVHTFHELIPPSEYFEQHPEYFSLVGGKRLKEKGQLCCTNKEVIQLCAENTLKAIRRDPNGEYCSVSQEDWDNHCECEKCQALAAAEESQMAPILYLVNRVAEAVEREFPDKAIEALAYMWARKLPKTIRPRHNVNVRLCTAECCFMHPLETCDSPENRAFREDLRSWASATNRLWVWDYTTNFESYLCPYPNLHVRRDNIQFLVKNHVRGILEQDNFQSPNGELSPLAGYISAKFLWNPNYSEDQAIHEFLDGVYGKAAAPIRAYIDMLRRIVEDENLHVGAFVNPLHSKYLTEDIVAKADVLWDQAEAAVADTPDMLQRVRLARLPVDYVYLEQRRESWLQHCNFDHEKLCIVPEPKVNEHLTRFFAGTKAGKVTHLMINELGVTPGLSPETYKESFPSGALVPHDPSQIDHLVPGINYTYHEGVFLALPDFSSIETTAEDHAPSFELKPYARQDLYFAMRFTGFIKVPRDGVYVFYTSSDDGSKLYIGSEEIVDNGGLHGLKEAGGCVALKAGLHPITVEYLQWRGNAALEVRYQGPGIEKQLVPAAVLFRAG